jgi:UDP-N-acetylglucosamine--N-acetylmuramyl-(pentapeptide) pyrophosphoryl-undecaprenol N-acetylglucosamine transferase
MQDSRCVLIMAGGTGGHVIPALEVAHGLKKKGYRVHWLGTKKGIESRLVPAAGFPIHYLDVSGVRGAGLLRRCLFPFVLCRSVMQSIYRLLKLKPDLVMGFGGYASGPGGLAAFILRKPIIVHEQNAVAGKTNVILSYLAKRILVAFPNTQGLTKGLVVGNPVRSTIAKPSAREESPYPFEEMYKKIHGDKKGVNVLVLGGSGGAKQLNQIMPTALGRQKGAPLKVWHQSGIHSFEETQSAYQKTNLLVLTQVFIDEMAEAYAWADIVICRAGAMTVFEIMAAGKAAIFVPYPYAVDDHQTANANYLVEKEAALMIPPEKFSIDTLSSVLKSLVENKGGVAELGRRAHDLYTDQSLTTIIKQCEEVLGSATKNVSS